MKTKHVRSSGLFLAVGGLAFISGCVVAPPGPVMEVRPEPVVVEPVPVMVPASYVIVDGEYIGWVGNQYFYLGYGNVWRPCDPLRMERFHRWERSHHDWRTHAIPNDHFRRGPQGYEHPRPNDRHDFQPGRQGPHEQPGRIEPRGQHDHNIPPRGQPGPNPVGPREQQLGRNNDPRMQPGRNAPHMQPSPSQVDPRIHTGRDGQRTVQPGPIAPRAVQPNPVAPSVKPGADTPRAVQPTPVAPSVRPPSGDTPRTQPRGTAPSKDDTKK
jgi:hypothetical protein